MNYKFGTWNTGKLPSDENTLIQVQYHSQTRLEAEKTTPIPRVKIDEHCLSCWRKATPPEEIIRSIYFQPDNGFFFLQPLETGTIRIRIHTLGREITKVDWE